MEMRKQVSQDIENRFSLSKSPNRDLTIGESAYARQYSKAISILFSLNRSLAVSEEGLFTAVQWKTFFSAREKFLLCTPVNRASQSDKVCQP